VLDHDVLNAPAEQLLATKVELTVLEGKIVYRGAHYQSQ
jgi:predicted amidohydrolase YtcJ